MKRAACPPGAQCDGSGTCVALAPVGSLAVGGACLAYDECAAGASCRGNPLFSGFYCDQEQRGPLEQEISLDETNGVMMRLQEKCLASHMSKRSEILGVDGHGARTIGLPEIAALYSPE